MFTIQRGIYENSSLVTRKEKSYLEEVSPSTSKKNPIPASSAYGFHSNILSELLCSNISSPFLDR